MACEVSFVVNHEQQHQTEEEKLEAMWLDLVRFQTDYCLRLMAHVQTSRSASELDKVNVLSHLGRVMEVERKDYDGFRESSDIGLELDAFLGSKRAAPVLF